MDDECALYYVLDDGYSCMVSGDYDRWMDIAMEERRYGGRL